MFLPEEWFIFTGKILKKMAPHGLAFGEHFVEITTIVRNTY